MITEAILDCFIKLPLMLLSSVAPSSLVISIPSSVNEGLRSMLSGVAYVFPFFAIFPIFLAKQLLKGSRIAWAVIIRIKSFIPTMGA